VTLAPPAILLAAGASRRLGRPKQLAAWRGTTLVRRAARAAHGAGFAPIFAVVGAHGDAVFAEIADLATRVENAEWEEGMASSIRAGVAVAGPAGAAERGVLILLADQPAVDAALLRRLRSRFEAAGGRAPCACDYGGEAIGPPALFPPSHLAALAGLRGDRGARALLAAHRAELELESFPGGALDVDVEADLRAS
jgi:molybdenum cofactor cytidylyltransferase